MTTVENGVLSTGWKLIDKRQLRGYYFLHLKYIY